MWGGGSGSLWGFVNSVHERLPLSERKREHRKKKRTNNITNDLKNQAYQDQWEENLTETKRSERSAGAVEASARGSRETKD